MRILQIYRDFLRPGAEDAYREVEEEAARICARFGCPNPYVALESIGAPKEVWYLNGYRSVEHQEAVYAGYRTNAPLMAALAAVANRKAALVLAPLDIIARRRDGRCRGASWQIGEGRFLVISVSRSSGTRDGTVFVAEDDTCYVFRPAPARHPADVVPATGGDEARVFAVRPSMSVPADEWRSADPDFWAAAP